MFQLLENIKILIKYQKKINELSEERFNIFRICGVNHYEVTHSSILSELLSNDSSHNFGTKFLNAFIQTLKNENILPSDYILDFEEIKVIPEFFIGKLGRIDIFIKNSDQCIIIENKIYAKDQYEQLKRYETYGKTNYKNCTLIYLTLFGEEASEESARNSTYSIVSYNHTIINWLERCVEIAAKSPVVRETLIQYINHIKYLTNNTTLLKMNDEIVETLSQENNIEAAFIIGERLTDVKNYLINKIFLPQLNAVCKELSLNLDVIEYDRVNTAYSSFIINNPDWKTFKIGFEFESKGLRNLIVGIVHKAQNQKNEDTFNILKDFFSKKNDLWVWSEFPKYPNWDKNAMYAISNGEMIDIFKNEISRIIEITADYEM